MNLLMIIKITIFKKQNKNKTTMKNLILALIAVFSIQILSAQSSNDYIEEAYSLFKIKSFNTKTNTKNCEILAFVRVAEKYREAIYHVELLPNDMDGVIFRDLLDFTDMNKMVVAKSHRVKGDVYELNFGNFYVSEYAKMQLVIIYPDGSRTKIPMEMTNYKNPITIMN